MSSNCMRLVSLTLVVACLVCGRVPAYAQSQPVTLAWDASRESSAAGYIVYVGTAPGSYGEQYDVGDDTTFVYRSVRAGQPYFFTVAAYTEDRQIGPRSEEIFFMSGTAAAAGPSMAAAAPAAAAREISSLPPDRSAPDIRSHVCAGDRSACVGIEPLATVAGDVRALTPTGDGRLLFIENGTRVRMIAGDTLLPDAALAAEGATRLTGLVLDPAFNRNRFVYVGEIEWHAGGSRTLSILRYREVAGTFAEGAALVTALPLPPDGDAPFAMDGTRRLYVAVPESRDGSTGDSPYGGTVLRFENDGSVPRDSRGGSPVFAVGYAEPLSLAWNASRNELWLAGAGAPWDSTLARLPLAGDDATWPRAPLAAGIDAGSTILSLFGAGDLVLVDQAEGVVRVDGRSLHVIAASSLGVADLGGAPISAALDGDDVYVVVADDSTTPSGPAFSGPAKAGHYVPGGFVRIVRLRPNP